MRSFFHHVKRLIWAITVGFMIAWHNVYFQDDRVKQEDMIETVMESEDGVCEEDFTSEKEE